MPTIDPDPKRLPELLASLPQDTPVVMLNLLRFRDQARYGEGASEPARSGRQAYGEYSKTALRKVQGVGGELVWMGRTRASLIAPEGEQWDEVLLVRYPSAAAFASMLADPEYQAATRHRTAALEEARLIANVE
ncbi:DUF1330 domain-containing protein [Isoalcanivorax indicus]|uniref:DUF1330 domain-containing protein n=1 Tax=Isoalcanivorax indicus TaxID=2202653 RepID=UPI000DB90CB0|nr:DUF1330 domain-containing protein [Isoalcanivorax indicus]